MQMLQYVTVIFSHFKLIGAAFQGARPEALRKDPTASAEKNPFASLPDDSQERLAKVQSFWSTSSWETRRDLLTLQVPDLMEAARRDSDAYELLIRTGNSLCLPVSIDLFAILPSRYVESLCQQITL